MPFVSVTRLRLRSIRFLIPFFRANEAAVRALVRTEGFMGGAELTDRGLVFWTWTVWENEEAMRSFRNGPAHVEAMKGLPRWCSEASYGHWTEELNSLQLDWGALYQGMSEHGRLTKVRHPSSRQLQGIFPPPRWVRMTRLLRPVSTG
jgi:hypothetical protein